MGGALFQRLIGLATRQISQNWARKAGAAVRVMKALARRRHAWLKCPTLAEGGGKWGQVLVKGGLGWSALTVPLVAYQKVFKLWNIRDQTSIALLKHRVVNTCAKFQARSLTQLAIMSHFTLLKDRKWHQIGSSYCLMGEGRRKTSFR